MSRNVGWTALIVVVVIAVLGGCGGCFYATQLKTGEVEFTVESKERIAEENDGKWMVFATDGQTYQVTDNWFFGLTESTDRYRALEVGATYRCSTVGVRWSLISEYKNLRDCELVEGAS